MTASTYEQAGRAGVDSGTGQNLPISVDQVSQVLGSGTVAELAKKAGIGESETTGALASLGKLLG